MHSNGKFQVKSALILSVGEEDFNQALMKYIFLDKMIKKDKEKKLKHLIEKAVKSLTRPTLLFHGSKTSKD